MKTVDLFKREEGFWSTFVLLFVVTLALLGVGAHHAIMSEGLNIVKGVNKMQSEYAADGATFLAVRAMSLGRVGTLEGSPFTIGGATVTVDTIVGSRLGDDLATTLNTRLTVTTTKGYSSSSIEVWARTRIPLVRTAAMAGGAASNITTRDSTGGLSNLLVQNLTATATMPVINVAALNALSTTQAHDQSATTFSPATNYPAANFYRSGTIPNVTHVFGNLNLIRDRTIYGIFVVEGNVTIERGSQVIGVIYCPNVSSVTINSPPATNSVTGGIVTRGTITGVAASFIRHQKTFMTVFTRYLTSEDLIIPMNATLRTNKWTFIT
jgi:hypothetical protein